MYPSTKALVEASDVEALTGKTTEQQDALRAEGIIAVEAFCRQSFTAEGSEESPVTHRIDGTGARALDLPRRLAALTDLQVTTGLLGAADVVLSDAHDRLQIADESAGSTWATRVIAENTGSRRALFPSGPGTVEASGVWGWTDEEYPDAITTALRLHMEDAALAETHALSETVRAARALGLGSVAQGGLSVDLSRPEPVVSARVARVLRGRTPAGEPYVWTGVAGALA